MPKQDRLQLMMGLVAAINHLHRMLMELCDGNVRIVVGFVGPCEGEEAEWEDFERRLREDAESI